MKRFETDAIVLSTCDHAESDRLVTFHSAEFGRLRGIAKGARRSKKRFANVFEPCSLVRLECREKNSYIWIEACKLVEPYLPMRTDIEKWAYAALFSEIVLEMVPEGEPHPAPFILHKETLDRLERDKDPEHVLLLALLRFQLLMGYMPELEECAICRRALKTARKWFWQPAQGKLVCTDHFSPDSGYIALDTGTLALINYMRKIPLEKTWRLRMRREMRAPLLTGLLDWFRYHTRKEIQSIKVLEQIFPSCGISSSIVGSGPARQRHYQIRC
ncbi:MAG: DNA repair protein RecO [Deltaproteobacteria bacterium]|jgi:DNA repair protein RecO (recombination protein O)|nr:DNA repair protein RecO [Deltaproteobacteria bacterium]MDA8305541.1 DNA repair protein RecO [Deltaproteobacteria bacterium]